MKSTKALFLPLFFVLMITSAKAQQKDPWSTYMTPGEKHQVLESYSGEFTMEITMWMSAGKEPQVFQVKAVSQMILGGRFLQISQSGTMAGMDYQGITTIGYNTIDQKYALTTITNMGTGLLSLNGPWDEKTSSASLTGKLTNPVTRRPILVRQVISFPDKDSILIENFDRDEGEKEDRKTVQYLFRRIGK